MHAWEFFLPEETTAPDPFGWPAPPPVAQVDTALLERLLVGPDASRGDIEVAVALARFVHQEYAAFATEGSALTPDDSRLALRSLSAVLDRIQVGLPDLPFRDFDTFKKHWRTSGATGNGSWQLRRDMLDELFEPLHQALADRETAALNSDLVSPISPRMSTGWPRVDEELNEMRRHFAEARTEQDYSNVGNDAVAALEAVSAAAYIHDRHGEPGAGEPAVSNTKHRLERVVAIELGGAEHAELRKVVRATIELAQATKHRRSGDRRSAGMTADAVLVVTHLLRRLSS